MFKPFFSKSLMTITGFLLMNFSFALQIKPITENGTAKANITIHELTRIAVDQDRIVRVRGIEGVYEMKSDPLQGAIFIEPISNKKPFTIFLATEQNHNYVLELTPKDKTADTILIKPKDLHKKAEVWERNSPYTQTLVALTFAMINHKTPPGYETKMISHIKSHRVNGLKIRLIRIYVGVHLRGYVYRMINSSRKTRLLNEPMFYQKEDCSIALSGLTLLPKSEALLYKVRCDE